MVAKRSGTTQDKEKEEKDFTKLEGDFNVLGLSGEEQKDEKLPRCVIHVSYENLGAPNNLFKYADDGPSRRIIVKAVGDLLMDKDIVALNETCWMPPVRGAARGADGPLAWMLGFEHYSSGPKKPCDATIAFQIDQADRGILNSEDITEFIGEQILDLREHVPVQTNPSLACGSPSSPSRRAAVTVPKLDTSRVSSSPLTTASTNVTCKGSATRSKKCVTPCRRKRAVRLMREFQHGSSRYFFGDGFNDGWEAWNPNIHDIDNVLTWSATDIDPGLGYSDGSNRVKVQNFKP